MAVASMGITERNNERQSPRTMPDERTHRAISLGRTRRGATRIARASLGKRSSKPFEGHGLRHPLVHAATHALLGDFVSRAAGNSDDQGTTSNLFLAANRLRELESAHCGEMPVSEEDLVPLLAPEIQRLLGGSNDLRRIPEKLQLPRQQLAVSLMVIDH